MKRIPIKALKEFAKAHGLDQVIVVGWRKADGREYVATYGKSLSDCAFAAQGGNLIKKIICHWPDELCQDVPARVRRKLAASQTKPI